MEKLQIKSESLPERCEVCHQSDLFDPETGHCSRCGNVPAKILNNNSLSDYLKSHRQYGGISFTKGGIWRENDILVMHKNSLLPERCIKCNTPTNGLYLRKKLSWYHPAWNLLILVGFWAFLIVIFVARKTATVEIGMCETHMKERRNGMILSWSLAIFGFGFLIFNKWLLGIVIILASIIYAVVKVQAVSVSRIDDHYIRLKRINKRFLAELPSLPERLF
jgi:hypothetical protein